MTDDPAPKKVKPTRAQAKAVYDSQSKPTCDTLFAELTDLGFKTSRSTCARWAAKGFAPKRPPKGGPPKNMEKGEVKGVPTPLREAIAADAMVGTEMTKEEASVFERERAELWKLELPELKGMQEKERVIYNIMMLRASQRIPDKLVLIPRDSAAFVGAMTEAAESLSTVAAAHPGQPGDDAKLIEATVNPPNPVSEAIAAFKRRQGVAA